MEEKEVDYKKPSYEEFMAYAHEKRWDDWAVEVWNELERTNWLMNNHERPKSWMTMANARNGAVMERLHVKKPTKTDIMERVKSNATHHITAYTFGCCDNFACQRPGGAAYMFVENGRVVQQKNHGQLNTTNNRMLLLSIISAVNACPEGAFVDIYTESQYCLIVLSNPEPPRKNTDLYDLYRKCSAHLAGIRIHWVKGTSDDRCVDTTRQLAYEAYCNICSICGLSVRALCSLV